MVSFGPNEFVGFEVVRIEGIEVDDVDEFDSFFPPPRTFIFSMTARDCRCV